MFKRAIAKRKMTSDDSKNSKSNSEINFIVKMLLDKYRVALFDIYRKSVSQIPAETVN